MSTKNKIKYILPLTPMQEGILFHSIKDNKDSAYFEQLTFTIAGDLDVEALHRSLDDLFEQNDIFRTIFVYEKVQKPRQIVINKHEAPFSYQDVSLMTQEESEKYIQDFEEKDRQKGFNLSKDPLFRLSAIKTSEKKFRLIIGFHHIILDGWSLGIVLGELFQSYHRIADHQRLQRPPRRSFHDYIDWLERRNKEEAREYWSQHLKGYEQAAVIPSTKYSSNECVYVKNEIEYTVDGSLYEKLKLFSHSAQVTINTLFQTIWGIVLQQYNNTDDVVFGMVVSGRHTEVSGMDSMIGMFINTIPVRIQADPTQSFIDLAKKVQFNMVQSERYDCLSIAQIQTHLNLSNQLINHIVVFENYQKDQDLINLINGGEAYRFRIENLSVFEQTNYHLNIIVIPGEKLIININFNETTYDRQIIHNILKHIVNVMRQIVDNNQIRIQDIELMDEDEKQLMMKSSLAISDYPREKSIDQFFREVVGRCPHQMAIECEKESLTYRELDQASNRLAVHLRELSVQRGDIVAVLIKRSPQYIVGILSILKAGGAYLPIDSEYPEDRIQEMLGDANCKLLIVDHDVKMSLTNKTIVNVNTVNFKEKEEREFKSYNDPHDLAYVMYTSGSTGKPKGVMIPHRAVMRLVMNTNYIHFDPADRILMTGSISFDASTFEIWGALLNGLSLVIINNHEIIDANQLEHHIIHDKISILWLTAPLFNQHVEQNPNMFQSLRVLIVGGDVLSVKHIDKLRTLCPFLEMLNGYGPTENTTFSTTYQINGSFQKSIPIGKPISNSSAFIFNSSRKMVPVGVPGEIYVGGDGLAIGYLNRPDLTKEKFIPNPYETGSFLYRTGDLGRWLSNGNIEFLGRMDNQVKIRGYRVELGEIGSVLSRVPGIQEVIVLTRSDQYGQKYICAYFTAETSLVMESIKKQLARQLPAYMIPTHMIQMEKIPLNQNGKIDHSALPMIKKDAILSEKKHSPAGDREIEIARVWGEVLGIQGFDRYDNFFDMGGHSLTAIQVYTQLSQRYQFTIQDLFDYKTIHDLALRLKPKNDTLKDRIQSVREMAKKEISLQASKNEKPIDYAKKISGYQSVHLTKTIPYQHVLLCGSTGYFGIHVLDRLLDETNTTIHCLIKGKDSQDAVDRLKRKCLFYFNEDLMTIYPNRIVVHRGDLSQTRLGLDENEHLSLSKIIDCVINAAANVRHYGHDRDFYDINVIGVENLIQFALTNRKKDIHHISTLSVGITEIQNQEISFFTEFDYGSNVRFQNQYIQTKLEAEKKIFEARTMGIDTSIYRVGNLMFHSETGKFQENIHENAFYQSLRSYLRLGCFPDFSYQNIDFTFVDMAAKAMLLLFNKYDLKNEVHHIMNPNLVSLSDLGHWMKNSGYGIQILPTEMFLDYIIENSHKKEMKDDIQNLMIYSYALFNESKRLIVKNGKTDYLLKKMGFEWKALAQGHIDKMLAYSQKIFLEIQ